MILQEKHRTDKPPFPRASSLRQAWQESAWIERAPEQVIQIARHFQSCRTQSSSVGLLQLPRIAWTGLKEFTYSFQEHRRRLYEFFENAHVHTRRKTSPQSTHVFRIPEAVSWKECSFLAIPTKESDGIQYTAAFDVLSVIYISA